MNIVIVGCGKVGTTVLASLLAEGHDIVAVDNNPDVISDISNIYDGMCVCGSGTDYNTLAEAGVADAELFVATTCSDELNMLSCFLAKRMGAKHTAARIRNPQYNERNGAFLRQQLDISLVFNPDLMAAQELYHMLKLPSAVKIEYFSRRSFEMVELRLREDSKLLGLPLWELRKHFQAKFLVCAVQRGDEVFIPDGSCVLEVNDRVELTAAPTEIQKLLKELGLLRKQARNVMLLGASRMAFYLAKMLIAGGTNVKIIEQDKKRCREITDKISDAVVICGDGAKQELLLEEGVTSMDAFAALTGMDEENILISYFAANLGVKKVIPKINRDGMYDIADKLGLDSRISSRHTSSNVLTRYARALQNSMGSNMETLYKLMDGKCEALEFRVESDFDHLNIPLKDMKLKPGVLIAGILRGRRALIPSGVDTFQADDHVIIMTAGHYIHDLQDILL